MKNTFTKITAFVAVFAMVMASLPALAAAPQNASDNMTRQKVSEIADHVITFTLPTSTSADATITFPADFNVSGASPSVGTFAGQVLTIPNANLTFGSSMTVTITDVANPATPGNQSIAIATDVDAGTILVPIVLDDQIRITARVAQTLTFDVQSGNDGITTTSDNIVGFGDLDSATARYATDDSLGNTTANTVASQLFAETNAPGGYTIDVEGDTLTSMQNPTDKIDGLTASTAAPAAGTEAFGLKVVAFNQDAAGAGAVSTLADTVEDNFEDYDMTDAAGTPELLATQSGPVDGDVYDVAYIANIAPLTPAGDYATVLTYTMTANF